MTPEEIDKIAECLIEKVQARKHNFWIDPEQHYQDHQRAKDHSMNNEDEADLRQLLGMFRTARGLFFKAFVGLAIIGALVLMGIGLAKEIMK